ncbi:hypothetical protein [Rubrivirga sp.]|uniref:hypothetical protein n=1 Tax=Rubrivirga sp. TaxID=1885344 RepID=UPI003C770711
MRWLLLALIATSATAQTSVDDVWISFAPGVFVADETESFEDFLSTIALQASRGRWTGRLAYAESGAFQFDFSGAFSFVTTGEQSATVVDVRPTDYRSLVVAAGPRTGPGPFTASILVGPALTWGDTFESRSYRRVGVGVTAQAGAQVVGPVWAGLEANGIVNSGASHAGVGGVLRIDLRRAPR